MKKIHRLVLSIFLFCTLCLATVSLISIVSARYPSLSKWLVFIPQSNEFSQLLVARDNESWFLGYEPAQAGFARSNLIIVAFWSSFENSAFILADKLGHIDTKTSSLLPILAIEMPSGQEQHAWPITAESLKGLNVRFPVFYDADFRVWKLFGSQAWPSVIVVDQISGDVVKRWSAAAYLSTPEAEIIEDLKRLVRQYPRLDAKKDSKVDSLQVLSEKFDSQLDLRSTLFAQESFVSDVVVHDDGFFLADPASHQIISIDKNGKLLKKIGTGSPGLKDGHSGEAQLRFPHQIALDQNNHKIYIADWGNRRIRSYDMIRQELSSVEFFQNELFQEIPEELTLFQNRLLVSTVLGHEIFSKNIDDENAEFEALGLSQNGIVPSSMVGSREFDILYLVDKVTKDLYVYDFGNFELRKIIHLPYFGTADSTTLQLLDGEVLVYLSSKEIPAVQLPHQEKQGSKVSVLNFYYVKEDRFEEHVLHLDLGSNPRIAHTVSGPPPLPLVGGVESNIDQVVYWDRAFGKICKLSRKDDAVISQSACISYLDSFLLSEKAQDFEATEDSLAASAEIFEADQVKDVPLESMIRLKAGVSALFEIELEAPPGFEFSERDVHLLQTPDQRVIAWNPTVATPLVTSVPVAPARGELILKAVICKKIDPLDCRKSLKRWATDAKLTFTQSEFLLRSQLQF